MHSDVYVLGIKTGRERERKREREMNFFNRNGHDYLHTFHAEHNELINER